jgi:hypothetical protein
MGMAGAAVKRRGVRDRARAPRWYAPGRDG